MSSVRSRDVLWDRVFASLPEPLSRSLLDAGLADTSTLRDYPRLEQTELEDALGENLVSGPRGAPSGAATTEKRSILSPGSSTRIAQRVTASASYPTVARPGSAASAAVGLTLEGGGDPRTVHVGCSGVLIYGERISPRKGGLATQTAIPCSPVVSRSGCWRELRDGSGLEEDAATIVKETETSTGRADFDGFELPSRKTAQSIASRPSHDESERATPKTAQDLGTQGMMDSSVLHDGSMSLDG